MFDEYPDVIRPSELKEMLHIGRSKTYQLLKTRSIPSRRIGGNYFIRKIDVIHFMDSNK